jgi:hypothetical protein
MLQGSRSSLLPMKNKEIPLPIYVVKKMWRSYQTTQPSARSHGRSGLAAFAILIPAESCQNTGAMPIGIGMEGSSFDGETADQSGAFRHLDRFSAPSPASTYCCRRITKVAKATPCGVVERS